MFYHSDIRIKSAKETIVSEVTLALEDCVALSMADIERTIIDIAYDLRLSAIARDNMSVIRRAVVHRLGLGL